MYPLVPNSIKQYEIINGYNNYNKNDKFCYEIHKDYLLTNTLSSQFKKKSILRLTLLQGIGEVRTYFKNPFEFKRIYA
jgi:hypothetical protein